MPLNRKKQFNKLLRKSPIGGPYDTGGLDRGDPTSFAPPTEELEPAYVKRERERDRKRLLSQTQRQLRKR